jgi:hypothetical protein
MCLASGCNAVLDSPSVETTNISGSSVTIYRGTLRYTGACGTAPSPDDPDFNGSNDDSKPRPECTPASSGQTYCMKPNGDNCYSASTGRTICWHPGETGQKTDGPTIQVRKPGTEPPGEPTPPEGEDLKDSKPPVTVTTTTGGGTVIITTTGTWTTTNGTNGGPSNDGEPDDGGSSSNDPGDGKGSSVEGGSDCDTPPVCSNDAVGCAILYQQFRNRCNSEGTGLTGANAAGQAAEDQLPAEGSDTTARVVEDNGEGVSGVLASASGWADRGQCPVDVGFDISLGHFSMPKENLCSVMDALAALVLLAGYIAAGFILLGANKQV